MKGIIVYSSKTGNTKNMAEFMYKYLKESVNLDISSVEEIETVDNYDFALLGGWVDKATLDSKIKRILKTTKQKNLGLFATLGAMPDSEHGIKVRNNLKNLLEDKNSLGFYICPGLVDPKLIEKMRGFTGMIVPKKIKEQMIQAGLNSRVATEEELLSASEYFKKNIVNTMKEEK